MSSAPADRLPRNVVLFSGHMIDASDRKTPRFPPEKEPVAAAAIADALAAIGVAKGDLGICGGACGGDLLFAEACLALGMGLEIYHSVRRANISFQLGGFRRRQLARPLLCEQSEGDAAHRAR